MYLLTAFLRVKKTFKVVKNSTLKVLNLFPSKGFPIDE